MENTTKNFKDFLRHLEYIGARNLKTAANEFKINNNAGIILRYCGLITKIDGINYLTVSTNKELAKWLKEYTLEYANNAEC